MQRTWVWENYYKDDQDRKDFWLAGAAALRRINPQVLEDIEDFILLKGFNINPHSGQGMSQREITQRINRDLEEKRQRERMALGPGAEKDENFVDPLEAG